MIQSMDKTFMFVGALMGGIGVGNRRVRSARVARTPLAGNARGLRNRRAVSHVSRAGASGDRRDHAARRWPRGGRSRAGVSTTGIVLFSGSLYALALSGVTTLGAITPLGGVAFIVGWISSGGCRVLVASGPAIVRAGFFDAGAFPAGALGAVFAGVLAAGLGGGGAWYSIITSLMMAIGPPGGRECRRSFGAFDGQLLAEDADLILTLRNRERDRLLPRRRNRLQAARACAAANPIDQIVRRTKLVLHDRAAEQRVVHASTRRSTPCIARKPHADPSFALLKTYDGCGD